MTASAPSPTFEITHGPAFALLRVDLQPGQQLFAEAGAMVARQSHLGMRVRLNAGRSPSLWARLTAFFVAWLRKMLGGETFFVSAFETDAPGSVWLAPAMSGQITHRRLNGERLILSAGAYLASAGDIDVRLRFGGLRALLAREGLFFLEVSGHGDLWITSYGAIHAIDLERPFLVDTGHLVGFEGALDWSIRGAGGGLMGLVASGEGLVCEFRGRGRVYLQSRNESTLVHWLGGLLGG
ncbi:MAG: TIGR00266 family protein [Myxococcota bacterium]|nr:TIGR00266 family protein [Myxococcota bacterium]MDW8363021.1 TIGR00266 family protein [Myxococcales bacterium]